MILRRLGGRYLILLAVLALPAIGQEPKPLTPTPLPSGERERSLAPTPLTSGERGRGEGEPAQTKLYEFRKEHDPNGTGKFYMGREIALVMSHLGANWLERPEKKKSTPPSCCLPSRSSPATSWRTSAPAAATTP
jgi:hypothetical protein